MARFRRLCAVVLAPAALLGAGLLLAARDLAPPAAVAEPAAIGTRSLVVVSAVDPAAAARSVGGEVVERCDPLGWVVVRAPGDARALAARLAATAGVAWAEPNRSAVPANGRGRCACQGAGGPPAPAPDVWDLAEVGERIGLAEAWEHAPTRGQGVLVGVVDTGVDPTRDALAGVCEPALDLIAEATPAQAVGPADPHGHGSLMAGIVAGRGDGRGKGFIGVAPEARILPVRVADERGGAPVDRVARGIQRATDRGARVIYVGLGVRGRSPTLASAVAYARAAGALVVAPAGNDGLDQVRSPACEAGVLGVGGEAHDGGPASCSNLDGALALVAPAEFVPAPARGRTAFTEGTSSSAALAAGVAALVLSRAPELPPDAVARCLVAGARPLDGVSGPLLERLPARALDAAGAVVRAGRAFAEVAVSGVRIVPASPQPGVVARVEVTLENRGHVPLERLTLAGRGGTAALETAVLTGLAPGARTTVTLAWTPQALTAAEAELVDAGELALHVVADPAAIGTAAAGDFPPAPVAARALRHVALSDGPRPSVAVAGLRVLAGPTLDDASARFEVTLENRGAAPAEATLQAAVDGKVIHTEPVRLAAGERAPREVRWTAPAGQERALPVHLEVYVQAEGDLDLDDDLDTLDVALTDPSLPLETSYRQEGDIDFGVDIPWRVAADRPSVPLLIFVPSIGRPSRYATFSETLAMRRGAVRPTDSRTRAAASAARRVSGDLLTYTAATFIKELGQAARGDDQALRRFFDKLATTDFALDYALYAAGSAGGRKGFELVANRAKKVPGLRWTGTSLGSTIARSQCAVALGYLLPNLVRGRLDRQVAIDLAALGITTAGVEALTAGMRAGVARTSLGARSLSWLARHGRIARTGAWAVDVGQLVLVLYASEWISTNIERPILRMEARRALTTTFDAAQAAVARGDEAATAKALDDLEDAFDAYRNVVTQTIQSDLRELNHELAAAARTLFQLESTRTRTEDIPPALAESRERVLARREAEADAAIRAALAKFEAGFDKALASLEATDATATLDSPGNSKPALFELQLSLLARLEGQAPAARKAQVAARRETLGRLRDLDKAVLEALVAGTGAGAPVTAEAVAGTDGLTLTRVKVEARDAWHEEAKRREDVDAQPNKFAPPGAIKTARLYEHDLSRDLVWAAPGVVRLDEMGAPQQDVALFDGPRPLTMKGRYNMLRIPRRLLEPLTVGGAAFVDVLLEWELTKVVRGSVVRPAKGHYSQMLRVALGEAGQTPLPTLPGLKGQYLDPHYHTIAEWYNPEPGIVADLEVDAPRQKYGGPIPMLLEGAYAVGAIDAPTYEAAREKLITTDHNAFYVANDALAHRPPYGPTSLRESHGLSEHARMRELLGESAAEELCYQKPGFGNTGVHMLDYRARHYDGTWNAQEPMGRLWRRWTDPMALPTMEGVLGDFAKGEEGNSRAFAFASHPVSTIPWENEKLVAALTGFARAGDASFAFRGMQVWNSRSGRRHSLNKLYKYVDDLNPFVSTTWQAGYAFDTDIHGACIKYRHLLRATGAMRHPLDPSVRFVRKHYILAGSDGHGDFNYTVGGLATVILALAGLNDRTDDSLELEDSAFFKVRTFVATDGYESPSALEALGHGSSAITDGPLVWFELDGDGRFDAQTGALDLASAPRFSDREGRIGGAGRWDGGKTVALANDARPVFRYAYTNFDEFGRPRGRDQLGRALRHDGGIDGIAVYKTDLEDASFAAGSGKRLEADGSLDHADGRAFGRSFTEALDEREEGPVRSVSAIQLGVSTTLDANTSPADVFRCLTNPVWAVRVGVQAHLDASKFSNGVFAPGGLVVEVTSPVSLAQDRLAFALCPVDASGKSGAPLVKLEADGWRDGTDAEGKPYKGGVLRLSNRAPVTVRGLPVFGAGPKVTLALISEKPLRDAFGNAWNRVASTFEVDPATGAPGRFADARGDVPAATFDPARGRGIIDALRDE